MAGRGYADPAWIPRPRAGSSGVFHGWPAAAGWNHWAEVVWRDPRTPRFIGDMPHTWVGSDFIRAARSLFVYEREADQALVIGAGIPAAVSYTHLIPPLYGALLKNEQDVHLFERLLFMSRRQAKKE